VPRNWASFPPFTLPVIALRVVDTIVRALVDTGASFSLIDPRLVTQLGLTAAGTRSIIGLGTTPLQVSLVTLNSVVIGRCPLQPFTTGIIDLTHLRLGIQLVLGINAFRGYRLQFDMAEGRVYLLD
jgi:predicted aspartyl protease